MQDQYVLRVEDQIPYDQALASLGRIQKELLNNSAWKDYELGKDRGVEDTTPSKTKQKKSPERIL